MPVPTETPRDNLNKDKDKGAPVEIPVIYIDGVCLLCEYVINFIYKRSKPGSFYFALLQEHPDIAKVVTLNNHTPNPNTEFKSTVVSVQDQVYISGEAVIFILQRMHPPFPLLGKILGVLPKVLVNALYSIVARNRFYFFKKKSYYSMPTSEVQKYFIKK